MAKTFPKALHRNGIIQTWININSEVFVIERRVFSFAKCRDFVILTGVGLGELGVCS